MDVKCIADEKALLGESPVWSAEENAVYWIDILSKRLHRTAIDTGITRSWNLPSCPGMIALRRRGGLVAALEDGLYAFSPETGALERLVALEADMPDNRPNDGKCDRAGRLWLGTLNMVDAGRRTGSLYRIDPDLTVTQLADGYQIPNGLAWAPDNAVMYHTDTREGVVQAYDFHPADGGLSRKRTFLTFDRAVSGGVDGAAMDADGGYWAAMYGGGCVQRTRPDGQPDRAVRLPVTQPTMPAFGGQGMDTLFVTTARQRLDDVDLKDQPLAGGLFAVPAGVRGHPVYPFGG